MTERPLILLSNDDGITSPGLFALKVALETAGVVAVFAPERNWTAAGHTKTLHKPLRVTPVALPDGSTGYAGSGAPADCVALALLGFLPRQPDLVVSGINRGANVGYDITYSGTVAAAMEGAVSGIPSIAASVDSAEQDPAILGDAAAFIARLGGAVLERGLPPYTLLNVNFPYLPAHAVTGVEITRQGHRVYRNELVEREDPRGRKYYWIGGDEPTGVPEPGTDIGALAAARVSITPITLDLTYYRLFDELRAWNLE